MKLVSCSVLMMALSVCAIGAHADTSGGELDGPQNAPSALIVQEDAQGNLMTFKSNDDAMITDDAAAQNAIAVHVNSSNEIAHIVVLGELDQTSSDETWFRWFQPNFSIGWGGAYVSYNYGWNYGFNLSGLIYQYASNYAYRWGGYIYHFFHRH